MVERTGDLDGKIFVGEFGKKGRETEGVDQLIFKDGKFRSTCCDPYGLGDATHTATVNGDAITFEAETFSDKEGRIKWSVTVKGDVLEGTFTWYPIGKDPIEYWIKT